MKDKLWDTFFKTGRISDYLKYKSYEAVKKDADGNGGNNP